MNVIRRFTLQSLKRNRKWTIVTIIGVIISTAMIAAVSTFVVSLMDLFQRATIADTGNWHAVFTQVEQKNVAQISGDKLVKDYILSRDIGYARLEGSQNADKPYLFIKQYDDKALKNFPVKLVSGRLPQNDREIVLSEQVNLSGKLDYKLWDRLTLQVGTRELDGKELDQSSGYKNSEQAKEAFVAQAIEEYTIVGFISRPGFEGTQAPGYTAVTYLEDSKLAAGETVNISIISDPDKNFYTEMGKLAEKAGISSDHVEYNEELLQYYGVLKNQSIADGLYQIMYVIIGIIMVASVSLIYNAFAISVSERTRQLGMLASVGATRRQKRQNVYFEGLIIGLVGIPLGILAGIGGIGITLVAVNPLLKSFMNAGDLNLHLVVSWGAVLIAALFSALTIFISAYIPARRAAKIMPIDAIRQSKEIKMTAKTVKTSRLTRKLFGFEGELALKNLKRNRKKYRATIISLVISLILFLTVSMYAQLLNTSSGLMLNQYNFDVTVSLPNGDSADSQTRAKETYNSITRLDTVKDYSIGKHFTGLVGASDDQLPQADVKNFLSQKDGKYFYNVGLIALDDQSFTRFAQKVGVRAEAFDNAASPQAILVNQSLTSVDGRYIQSEAIKVKQGETLTFSAVLSGSSGQTEKREQAIQVAAITDQRPIGVPLGTAGNFYLITTEKMFSALVEKGRETVAPEMYLTTDQSDQIEDQIKSVIQDHSIEYTSGMVYNNADNTKKSGQALLFLGVFVYGFIILISLICIANIFNTISTNIGLRRKEFAMLRSVGMTPKGFNNMLRFESIFYGLKALLYGIPLSIAISILLNKAMQTGISLTFALPWKSYGAAILMVFVIVAVTMLYSSSKVKRENIIDALKDDSN